MGLTADTESHIGEYAYVNDEDLFATRLGCKKTPTALSQQEPDKLPPTVVIHIQHTHTTLNMHE